MYLHHEGKGVVVIIIGKEIHVDEGDVGIYGSIGLPKIKFT